MTIIFEEAETFKEIIIHYEDVSNLTIGALNEYSGNEVEIYELTYSVIESGFNANIVLLLGIGKPSLSISFHFCKYQFAQTPLP